MMYLSDQWFAEAIERVAATKLAISNNSPVCFSYTVEGVPDGHPRAGLTVRYQISLMPSEGNATLVETDEPGDIRFSLRYSDALQIASGQRSGSRAFLDGDIRVGGDVAVLITRSAELEALNEALPTPAVSDA